MKQFIRYLYEYDRGNRIRNVGFTKVERQMDQCTVHIHGKGLDFGAERKLEVYLFYVKDGRCIGFLQGVIESSSPIMNYILKFKAEDVGDSEKFERINGIILKSRDGKKYAATWNDMPVDVENMRTCEEEEKEMAREPLVEHVEKLVEEQEIETIAPEDEAEAKEAEEVDSYVPPITRTYEKIQRQDISRLPRREWKLANNSFLLHGFYNYHHLLYIEEDENRWLGVPGIYHEKERAAARAFGFPEFHRITDEEVPLSDEEKNTYDDFGYWCRQVESRKNIR